MDSSTYTKRDRKEKIFFFCYISDLGVICHMSHGTHLVPFRNVKYDAPEEMGGDRICFDSPIRK